MLTNPALEHLVNAILPNSFVTQEGEIYTTVKVGASFRTILIGLNGMHFPCGGGLTFVDHIGKGTERKTETYMERYTTHKQGVIKWSVGKLIQIRNNIRRGKYIEEV